MPRSPLTAVVEARIEMTILADLATCYPNVETKSELVREALRTFHSMLVSAGRIPKPYGNTSEALSSLRHRFGSVNRSGRGKGSLRSALRQEANAAVDEMLAKHRRRARGETEDG